MKICKKRLPAIIVPEYLAYQNEVAEKILKEKVEAYPRFPFLYINSQNRLIFSAAFFQLLKKDKQQAEFIQLKVNLRQELILGWRLQKLFFGVSAYQQLFFLQATRKMIDLKTLQRCAGFSFTVNDFLLKNLDRLLQPPFGDALKKERLALKAALKMLVYRDFDFQKLIELFSNNFYNENEQLNLVDLFSELAFRQKKPVAEVIAAIPAGKLAKSATLRQELHQRLFPRYWKDFQQWKNSLARAHLPPEIRVEAFPFFEKNQYQVNIRIESAEKLAELLQLLKSF